MKTAILKLIKKANLDHEHCISLIGGGGKTTLVFELGDVFCKDEKTIFNLKVKHNYKYKEIGKELNMSVSQIKSNFNRSKKKVNTKGLGGTKNG